MLVEIEHRSKSVPVLRRSRLLMPPVTLGILYANAEPDSVTYLLYNKDSLYNDSVLCTWRN